MKDTTPDAPGPGPAHQVGPARLAGQAGWPAWARRRSGGATTGARAAGLALAMTTGMALAMSAGPAAAAPRQPAEIGATVFVKSATAHKYGRILVNQHGLALYYNRADSSSHWACTGACLIVWPPLTLPKGETLARLSNGVSGLGTVVGLTGRQVTWEGKALYTFSKDTRGTVKGDGVGHIWYVVRLSRAPAGTPPTTTTGGGY